MTASSTQHNMATDSACMGARAQQHHGALETTPCHDPDRHTQLFFLPELFLRQENSFVPSSLHASEEESAEQATEQEQCARRRADAVLSLTTQAYIYEAMAVQLRCARAVAR